MDRKHQNFNKKKFDIEIPQNLYKNPSTIKKRENYLQRNNNWGVRKTVGVKKNEDKSVYYF